MPSSGVPHLRIPHADKWVHGLLYFGFAVLWAFSAPAGGNRMLQMVVGAAIVLGWVIELLQGAIPSLGRSYDNYDLLADALGAAAGALSWKWAQSRAKARG
jgi:VanZ family protein